MDWIKRTISYTKSRFKDNNLDTVLWVVTIVPKGFGMTILKDHIYVPFWILHTVLLMYVWAVGSAVFQIKYAQGARDFIKSYVNVSMLVLTINNTYWFIVKSFIGKLFNELMVRIGGGRTQLKFVFTLVRLNDELCRETVALQEKYEKRMSVVKKIVFCFYALNLIDAYIIYVPHRVLIMNNQNSMTPCVGIEPLTAFPKRQICMAILIIQHVTMITVVLGYQAILLFLIAHTSAMYDQLSEDIMLFDKEEFCDTDNIANEKLPVLIRRHALILKTIDKIKALYSVPLGVNFGSNAVCICFFFYLPLQEWVEFSPILIYCFLVFFLYCFLCQRLINAAEKFERAVYSCGWENFNVKDQMLVYVMLMQAQRPILLLAADIIPVNIYTFATTLQAMFKFVTVVKF